MTPLFKCIVVVVLVFFIFFSRQNCVNQESTQRFSKQRDEQEVEYVADGKTIAKEMRYFAENENIERDGSPEQTEDWDSLSDRVRKARRQQKTLLQQHRGTFLFMGSCNLQIAVCNVFTFSFIRSLFGARAQRTNDRLRKRRRNA